jgi:hypothetical protein
LCSGYQQICQKVAPTIRQYGEREIPGGLEAAGLMRAVKASAEGTAQAIAMARTVQSFFCLGRFESCLPPSLKAKGAVGIIWLDPILRPLYWKEFTAFVTVLAEFCQRFSRVFFSIVFGRSGIRSWVSRARLAGRRWRLQWLNGGCVE